jgi:ATP-binding cassette subfamily F protein 3
MLSLHQLSKSYGSQVLFEDITLQMTPGERLGLVGRNGSGKSTLFRIVLGEEEADSGSITFPKNYRIGYLAQHLHFTKATVLEEGCLGLPPGEEDDHYKVERILFGLGFTKEDMERAPSMFSGGYQVRLNLAKVLVSNPNLLLLDEPTNYLDILSIRWITQFLRAWRNEIILISHDREFMDDVSTHTAALHRRKLRKIKGGTEKLYAQILQDEEIFEKTRQNEEKKRKQEEAFINRFRAQATKASAVQSRIKRLEKMPSLDKLAHIDHLDFEFHPAPFFAERLMEVRDLSFHFDPKIPLIQNLNLTIKPKDRIAIIGKNGKGKSTLLNLMAEEFRPVSGEVITHPQFKLGFFGQTNIDRLQKNLTVEEEILSANPDLGRTAVRTICGIMMFSGDHAEKKISVLSGGERSRVQLGKILAKPANLVFLDEPTNHLDMESIEALIDAIEEFEGAVVIVTHSEMILKDMATKLVVFQGGGVEVFEGTYEEFLDRIGWEDEAVDKPMKTLPTEKPTAGITLKFNPNKKEARKKRSEIIAERSRVLTPLKQEMTTLETTLADLEANLANVSQELMEASQQNRVEAYVTLSKTLKDLQKKIDESYARLEVVMTKHEEKSKKYETILAETVV